MTALLKTLFIMHSVFVKIKTPSSDISNEN